MITARARSDRNASPSRFADLAHYNSFSGALSTQSSDIVCVLDRSQRPASSSTDTICRTIRAITGLALTQINSRIELNHQLLETRPEDTRCGRHCHCWGGISNAVSGVCLHGPRHSFDDPAHRRWRRRRWSRSSPTFLEQYQG